MKTYDNSQAPHFMQLLARREAELRELLRAGDDLADQAGEAGPRDVVDFKDVAAEQMLATVDEAKAEHAGDELKQVLAARHRLQDHSYGLCVACGEAIDLRRLNALPAASYCVACQAIHEHERPQRR